MVYSEFLILTAIEEQRRVLSAQDLAKVTGMNMQEIYPIVELLRNKEYITDISITQKGLCELEPYRVKQAIFLAAGIGERLIPVTLNTPKPLVLVQGNRIIDSLLDAVVAAGIEEIYLVRGYLSEQFNQLVHKYPGIKFIENYRYKRTNNISSMMLVRHLNENAYVFEADLLLFNPRLISKYQYRTNYLGIPVEATYDWCMTSQNGRVTGMARGGAHCHLMIGVSYWTKQDRCQLAKHLAEVFKTPDGKKHFWDEVAISYFPNEYKIYIRECQTEDIIEIDTLQELIAIDSAYKTN